GSTAATLQHEAASAHYAEHDETSYSDADGLHQPPRFSDLASVASSVVSMDASFRQYIQEDQRILPQDKDDFFFTNTAAAPVGAGSSSGGLQQLEEESGGPILQRKNG
ncbi:unnamed protein product, partial [Amoebophrya sp. A120]